MISLPSFFKRKSSPPLQQKIEPSFRPRQSKFDTENEEVLTENPEIQRARHRLLGAAFLLFIAVIGLPKLFDAEPKKISNDVVVKVVQSVTNTTNKTSQDEKLNSADNVHLDDSGKVINSDKSVKPIEPMDKRIVGMDVPKTANEESKTNRPETKKGSLQTDPGEVVIAEKKSDIAKNAGSDNSPKAEATNFKYLVQIAALSSNDRVKALTAKVKELKIETYVLEKKRDNSNSPVIYLVRAGPFNTKEEAVAAEKKISALGMGLAPSIIEVNK